VSDFEDRCSICISGAEKESTETTASSESDIGVARLRAHDVSTVVYPGPGRRSASAAAHYLSCSSITYHLSSSMIWSQRGFNGGRPYGEAAHQFAGPFLKTSSPAASFCQTIVFLDRSKGEQNRSLKTSFEIRSPTERSV
jgi:hypothetical protein